MIAIKKRIVLIVNTIDVEGVLNIGDSELPATALYNAKIKISIKIENINSAFIII
jgi:hypothetical protein